MRVQERGGGEGERGGGERNKEMSKLFANESRRKSSNC